MSENKSGFTSIHHFVSNAVLMIPEKERANLPKFMVDASEKDMVKLSFLYTTVQFIYLTMKNLTKRRKMHFLSSIGSGFDT